MKNEKFYISVDFLRHDECGLNYRNGGDGQVLITGNPGYPAFMIFLQPLGCFSTGTAVIVRQDEPDHLLRRGQVSCLLLCSSRCSECLQDIPSAFLVQCLKPHVVPLENSKKRP